MGGKPDTATTQYAKNNKVAANGEGMERGTGQDG
jgi:hypothetical protein